MFIDNANTNLFMSSSRPFLKWAGGKHRVVEDLTQIATKIRPLSIDWVVGSGERYHEPFLGGGAMFFGLRSNGMIQTRKASNLNDINAILINCMRVVSDYSKLEKLVKRLKKLQKFRMNLVGQNIYRISREKIKSNGSLMRWK